MQVIFHDNSIKVATIAIYIGTSNTHLQHKKMFFLAYQIQIDFKYFFAKVEIQLS